MKRMILCASLMLLGACAKPSSTVSPMLGIPPASSPTQCEFAEKKLSEAIHEHEKRVQADRTSALLGVGIPLGGLVYADRSGDIAYLKARLKGCE